MAHNSNASATATTASRPDPELDALLALVAHMAVAASETTLLAAEVNEKLHKVLAGHVASKITWTRGTPPSATALAAAFPKGSGETWYVVIRGREPGFYRTSEELTAQTRGVPNQFGQKKTSRSEALAFYRENYLASAHYDALVADGYNVVANAVPAGVQKWVASVPAAV
ncbi:hypothetical protein C8F04DRAFT_1270208 [Mycena alexandri]|uniref:Ribonuclease H1 N-terminal domain-containing protein n=1 Tax=Mycena alexandri TaxID=1745969 RepID=A0AAD6SBL1_9AGAR|nr:hypothetical protein C8F04DRAFT_1270208 [Mycena alexandri]